MLRPEQGSSQGVQTPMAGGRGGAAAPSTQRGALAPSFAHPLVAPGSLGKPAPLNITPLPAEMMLEQTQNCCYLIKPSNFSRTLLLFYTTCSSCCFHTARLPPWQGSQPVLIPPALCWAGTGAPDPRGAQQCRASLGANKTLRDPCPLHVLVQAGAGQERFTSPGQLFHPQPQEGSPQQLGTPRP